MRTSDSINELATALSAAQGEMKAAPMTGRNPHLKNKYATLNDIIDTARPVLAKHALAYVQMPTSPDNPEIPMIGLTTRLMHKSGQWLEDDLFFPVDPGSNRAVNPAQVAGSTITYMRRYALAAMLGIVADEDADGEQPQAQAKPQTQRRPAPAQPQPEPVDPGPLPDDEQVVYETSAREFIPAAAAILETDLGTVKARLRALGYERIPGDKGKRLDAFRRLKTDLGPNVQAELFGEDDTEPEPVKFVDPA